MYKNGKEFYRELVWDSGFYKDVEIYRVFQKPGVRRSKCNPSSEVQKAMNEERAKRHLMRLAHLNFTEFDYMIGFDYDEDCLPADDAEAKRDINNALRRLKRLYKKNGSELKYLMAFERAVRTNRPHFHLIINNAGLMWEEIFAKWPYGRTKIRPLQFDKNGITGLSVYTSKGNLFGKRWCASKNLIQPKRPEPKDWKLTRRMIEAFQTEDHEVIRKTYGEQLTVAKCQVHYNEKNNANYIHIQMFDYTMFTQKTGKKPYTRIKKDKTAVRAPARRKE